MVDVFPQIDIINVENRFSLNIWQTQSNIIIHLELCLLPLDEIQYSHSI